MAYRRKGGPRGRKCIRRKRVRMRGGKYVLRCAAYGAKRSGGTRRRRSRKARRASRGYRRKPRGMARRGSRCLRYRYVRMRGNGRVRRCAKYSQPRRRRRGYRR